MIYINNDLVSIQAIRDYKGKNEAWITLKKALEKIDQLGWPITVRHRDGTFKNNPKSGLKEGKRLILMERFATIKTKEGAFTVRWVDSAAPTGSDGVSFSKEKYPFRKTRILEEGDIEEALYFVGICDTVRNGKLVIFDPKSESKAIADRRSYMADVNYLIYGNRSPLTNDRLLDLCYAWGVSGIENMSGDVNALKNALYAQVLKKEEAKDPEFTFEAFTEAAVSEEVPELMECMKIVRQAKTKKTIAWDGRNFAWILKTGSVTEDFVLLNVNPANSARKEELLARAIMADQKKKAMLMSGAEKYVAPVKPWADETPEEATERYTGLSKNQWKRLESGDFDRACEMAKVEKDAPPAVAVEMLLKFFTKK